MRLQSKLKLNVLCEKLWLLSGLSARTLFFYGLILSIVLNCGCAMVGPEYVRPEAPTKTGWLESVDYRINTDSVDIGRWWAVFNDPVLDKLIETARRQNLTLQAAGLRVFEARAQLGILSADLYPQLQQVKAAYSRTNLSENAPNTATLDRYYGDYQVGFDMAWELDVWGKFRRAIASGIALHEASIADYDDILVSLTAEISRIYVGIRILEKRLALAHENVRIQKRSLEIIRTRFRAGTATELDAKQAESLLMETKALIPRLESRLQQSRNAMSELLGKLPGEIDAFLESSQRIPMVPVEIAVGIPAELMRRRPDIRLAECRLVAQCARIGFAKADLYPHLSLMGSIGLQTGDAGSSLTRGEGFRDLFHSGAFKVFGGPSLSWDILNYGRIKNRVRVEDARFQQLIVSYRETVLTAMREAEDAMTAFLRSQVETVLLVDSVKASRRSVDLAMIQYREGTASYQRVLDTQRSLTQQQDALAQTYGSVTVNLIAIYKSLGGGWQMRNSRDLIPAETRKTMQERTDWGDMLERGNE